MYDLQIFGSMKFRFGLNTALWLAERPEVIFRQNGSHGNGKHEMEEN